MASVYNAVFNPITYDEFAKPLATLTQQHYAAEDTYAEMVQKASIYDILALQSPDSKSARMYKEYSDSIKQGIQALSENGYNADTRRLFNNARLSFMRNIIPMEEAKKKWDSAIELQQKANVNGNMRFTKRASEATLDDFFQPFTYDSVDLNALYTKGNANAQAWSKRFSETTEGERFKGDYLALIKTAGLNNEALKEGVKALIESGKYPSLTAEYNNLMAQSGALKLKGSDRDDAAASLLSGLSLGIVYDQNVSTVENWRRKAAYGHMLKIQEMRAAAEIELAKEAAFNADKNSLSGSGAEIENYIETHENIRNDIGKYFNVFDNGRIHLKPSSEYIKLFGVTPYVYNKDNKVRFATPEEYERSYKKKYKETIERSRQFDTDEMHGDRLKAMERETKAAVDDYKNFIKYVRESGIDPHSYSIGTFDREKNIILSSRGIPNKLSGVYTTNSKDVKHGSFRYVGLTSEQKERIQDRIVNGNPKNVYEVKGMNWAENKIDTSDDHYKWEDKDEVVSYNFDPNINDKDGTKGVYWVSIAKKGNKNKIKRYYVPKSYMQGVAINEENSTFSSAFAGDNPWDIMGATEIINANNLEPLRILKPNSKE